MRKDVHTMKTTGMKHRLWAMTASVLMLVMCMMTTTPAYATNVAPTGAQLKTTFHKYLVMDEDANVPNATFHFTISAGQAVEATGSAPAIYAGIGTPTVGTAIFAPSDSTTEGLPTDSGSVTGGKKYAMKEVTVDFSNVSFTAPGIYRYTISEGASSNSGITNDANTTRTLDVYVGYEDHSDTNLKVLDYVLQNGTAATPTTEKSDGFTNTYTTNDLTLEKQVTGNQGDREKYFAFSVTLSDAVAGTKYTVDLSNADPSPTVDGDRKTNPTSLTVGPDGTITATYYLKNDQSIVIQGLTADTKYTMTETDYSKEGYTSSYVLDSGLSTSALTTGEQTMGAAAHKVVFTNDKEGIVPTGILLETAPYVALGAAVIAGFILLFVTRRRHTR